MAAADGFVVFDFSVLVVACEGSYPIKAAPVVDGVVADEDDRNAVAHSGVVAAGEEKALVHTVGKLAVVVGNLAVAVLQREWAMEGVACMLVDVESQFVVVAASYDEPFDSYPLQSSEHAKERPFCFNLLLDMQTV